MGKWKGYAPVDLNTKWVYWVFEFLYNYWMILIKLFLLLNVIFQISRILFGRAHTGNFQRF